MKKTDEEVMLLLQSKQIPILVLDEKWHKLFKGKEKTARITALEKHLNDCLKKQAKITQDLKDLRKLKTRLMEEVVEMMDIDDDNPKKQKLYAKNQKLIYEAKAKIEELEEQEFEMPRVIRKANIELMLECMKVSYDRIEQNKTDIKLLDKWISEMRIELKKKLIIKQDKEIKNTETYAYLHDVFGQEVMEIFDAPLNKTQEKQ